MKKTLITILRNRNTPIEQYRQAADQLGTVLAVECDSLFPKATLFVDTPLARTHGVCFKHEFVLVPILRSGLALLPPFMRFHPGAGIGFIGTRRDEKTAIPELYYANLPPFTQDNPILLLDPMIATGGSAALAVKVLKDAGAVEKQITLISFIASPEGITRFQKDCPEVGLVVAQVDEGLDEQKRILPGLGDFGDRYFGTND
ncbi:MAG: uracil phosphoribosyltransferase [Verrucomicrobia bacterium]|nr:uracil phosphoribosyltransferase [Verrucomicrobiota bacterium]MBS0637758.1 uracil phosphoribosyltransferase [Verrucomicrobiota bacterium]